jgi:light-regulated signal transduction histidine kinase (bacteriophytochrome)
MRSKLGSAGRPPKLSEHYRKVRDEYHQIHQQFLAIRQTLKKSEARITSELTLSARPPYEAGLEFTKKLQKQIRDLQGLVEKRTDQLEQANWALARQTEELSRINSELERFAHLASHDLKEPLRTVSSFVSLLSKKYHGQLDADAHDYIGYAVEATTRMEQLILDVLAYCRVGSQRTAIGMVNLNVLLSTVLDNLKTAIAESGATVTHDSLPTVGVNETEFLQVFQNLISNAVKYHGKERPRVHIGGTRRPQDWLFSVQDNGIGIDPRYADRIFEIFQRLHARDEYSGTGVGLAICKKIVHSHGGRIWVESQLGHGATFYFTLPGPLPRSTHGHPTFV